MSKSNELRHPSSNLSGIFIQRILQPSFKKIEKYFPNYRADKLGVRKDTQIDRKTDRQGDEQTDRQTEAVTITPRPLGVGVKIDIGSKVDSFSLKQ